MIQPKFFEPLIQVLQHLEAPALHPNEHVRKAGLDRHRSVLELRMFVQHLEALRSILIRKRLAGAFQRLASAIRREMRRRAAIEPVIGHLKEDHRMRRNYLTGRDGDRINAVLAAAGYNFSLLLRWFEELLPALSLILWHALLAASLHLTRCRKTFFTADDVGVGCAEHVTDLPPSAFAFVLDAVMGGPCSERAMDVAVPR